MEWLRGWLDPTYQTLFQRIRASHIQNPLPLFSLDNLTYIITNSTSGPGLEIAKLLAKSRHIWPWQYLLRNPNAAHELIEKWQNEWFGTGATLNVEVMEIDLLTTVRFSKAWNARLFIYFC
eukprot:TRINITY_DN4616_c0_g1_i13.p1 TRINITY_DN4616_c0_g1~~TRINITY_DN4616_c0_g1_i13.p1  ORF type:complete len:121 (-),score=14.51 TRINITY_DN4616_c0_g1_i13:2795-3157(-)